MAIDKIPPGEIRITAERLFDEVDFPQDSHLTALIDHALAPDTALLDAWPGGRPSCFNLLHYLSGAEERVSPLLVELPTHRESRLEAIRYLLRKCNGQPMFSVLASPLSFVALVAHLAHFTQVHLPPDGGIYLLRFSDTRIAPTIARLLDPAQRSQMFGPLHRWAYLDRARNWTSLSGEGSTTIAGGPLLTLSEAQFDAFVHATLPDNFLAQLREEFPAFAELEPSGQHRLVCHWISQANEAAGGQAEPGECLAYCKDSLAA